MKGDEIREEAINRAWKKETRRKESSNNKEEAIKDRTNRWERNKRKEGRGS